MSKNMTRKGLAFGAGLALVVSGLGSVPASAVELNAGIPLAPNSGPATAYAIFADDGASFSVKGSPVTSIMGNAGTVKYKITDSNAKFVPGANTSGGITGATTDNHTTTNFVLNDVSQMVGIAVTAADGTYLLHSPSGVNADDNAGATNDVVLLAADSMVEAFVLNNILFFKSQNTFVKGDTDFIDGVASLVLIPRVATNDTTIQVLDNAATTGIAGDADTAFSIQLTNFGAGAGDYILFPEANLSFQDTDNGNSNVVVKANEGITATITAAGVASIVVDAIVNAADTFKVNGATELAVFAVPTAVRASDNSYVVDTSVTTAGVASNLEMVATDAVTRSVTVQAFVDDFSNDSIDAGSEYTSVAQVIQFRKNADVALVTSLVAPTPGDSALTATITTTPMINGAEDDRTSPIGAIFTRQDSVTKGLAVATQSNTTGTWTATVNTDISATTVNHWVDSATALDAESWLKSYTGTTGVRMDDAQEALARVDRARVSIVDDVATIIAQDGAVTDVTREAHFLQVGDKVTFGANAPAGLTSLQFTVASVPSEFNFTVAVAAGTTDVEDIADDTNNVYSVTTWAAGVAKRDRVYAGDHTAVGALLVAATKYEVAGASSASGTLAQTSADTIVTTVGSATIQEASVNNQTGDTVTDSKIKKDVTSVAVVASIVDSLGVSVGAGRSVAATVTVNSGGSAVKVNGLTAPANQVTDANGQVTFTVTDGVGATGTKVTLAIVPEGTIAAGTDFTIEWATQAYALYDLNTTEGALATGDRQILAGTSYAMDLLVADQWFQAAPSATYRLKVTGSGVTEAVQTLVAGKAAVTISDLGIGTSFATNLIVQKATSGVFADDTTTTITTETAAAAATSVTLAADGSALYASATADLSDAVAAKALVERDNRVAFVSQPAYTSSTGGAVLVTGKVTKKTNGTSSNDAVVTISGSNSILFSDGLVDKRGGVTVVADASGEFSVTLYSTSAMTNSVITVTAMGVSATTKVSFVGAGVGEGTSLVVTMPAAVKPATTFQVTAMLADSYGNGVDTAAGSMKVTYTGPGIVYGTLPTETDSTGGFQFSVLLGSNDTGTVSVTVSYDQNADGDYLDVKDLVTVGTTAITATGVVASAGLQAGEVVNVGTFNGKIVVYAKGMKGETITWKIAGKWVKVAVTKDYQLFDRLTAAIGLNVFVDVHRAGNKTPLLSKTVLTK